MSDRRHHVNESADKIVCKAKVNRGSDVRDQETVTVKVKGEEPETVAGKLDATLAALAGGDTDLREYQP